MTTKIFYFILLCCFLAVLLVGYIGKKSTITYQHKFKNEINKRDSVIFRYEHLLDSANINYK